MEEFEFGFLDEEKSDVTDNVEPMVMKECFEELEEVDSDYCLLQVTCMSRDEAEEILRYLPEGECFAVRYHKEPSPSDGMVKMQQRIDAMEEKRARFLEERSVRSFAAKTIGCKKCGSQLAKEFLKDDFCPLCGNDLRSQSTLDTLAQMDESLRDMKKELFSLTMLNRILNGEIGYLTRLDG